MKRIRHISATIAAATISLLMAAPAVANPQSPGRTVVQKPVSIETRMPARPVIAPTWAQRKISAAEAKSIALRRYKNARYVDIALRGNIYYVRLQINGRIKDVLVDAATGRIR